MTETAKKILIASAVVAGLVLVASILDLALGFPFAGYSATMDVCFILGSLIVLYLVFDSWQDLR